MLCRDEEIERALQTKNVVVHAALRFCNSVILTLGTVR
jgi:hypothetical protein